MGPIMRAYALPLAVLLLTASCSVVNKYTGGGLNTDSRLRVAEVAEDSGDSDTALSMYSAASTADPKAVRAQVQYAKALAKLGQLDKAKQVLNRALKVQPNQPDLQRELAVIEVVGGDFQQATARLAPLTLEKSKDADALIDRGVALDLAGHSEDARAMYARALKLRPDDMTAANDMAMSFMLDGRFKDALTLLAPFKERDDIPLRLRNNLAIAYAGTGDMASARAVSHDAYSDAQLLDVVAALQGRRPTADAGKPGSVPL